MKKLLTVLVFCLLLCSCASAATIPGYSGSTSQSGSAYGATLSFSKKSFAGGQMLPVYTGPGYEYYRVGRASVSTDETIWMAGREGDWALVMYQKNGGGFRSGYVDASKLMYRLGGRSLNLVSRKATMVRDCTMTDDPKNISSSICMLSAGESVTFLADYTDHHEWAYIEAWAEMPIRGFVLMSDIRIQ